MLYDPRWEVETKVAPKRESRFVRWLAKRPANATYNYVNPTNCGYAQYLRSFGCFALVGPEFYVGLWLGFIPVAWHVPAKTNAVLIHGEWTFGAALKRARDAGL
jgi:hypothetical protein